MPSISGPTKPQNHLEPAFRKVPAKLFVETTTFCNLGCFMCVKQTGACSISEGNLAPEIFAMLEPALPHVEALILNGVGEPLLHPQIEEFISRAKVLMPANGWVGFQSNGLLIDDQRAFALLRAGLDKICISVDSISQEQLTRMREGADIQGLGQALSALVAAKKAMGRQDFQIGVEIVVMRSNLAELPSTLRWAARHGASFALVTHVLPYDANHAAEAVYEPCSGALIELFNQWRKTRGNADIDLDRYQKILFKYIKTEEEHQVIEAVDQLKGLAEQKNVPLDLKKLSRLDVNWINQASLIFEEADRVAKAEGLELKLPELLFREQRRCEFIEDGSVFVSWQGDVHPCYFLWHGYHCYASGWKQLVQPRIFGNLKQQSLLDIWNSREFRAFRENVTRYDYPYCSSCGLAPCDYIQTEAFEQDCHINNEPCGSCLWCMGLFQCLR